MLGQGVHAGGGCGVSVAAVALAQPHARDVLRAAVWMLVTLAHLGAGAWAAARLVRRESPEERLYTAVLFGLGLATIALAAASTAGLSIGSGAAAMILADAVAVTLAMRVRHTAPAVPAASDTWERASAWIGVATLVAVVHHWFAAAVADARVTGTDAAHYHVPHAVNFMLGASPWGLLATPHLYPMNTSLLAAWFLLPTRDTLIVDLTLLLPFLLLTASLVWIFRLSTGRSGVAWAPWLVLLLACAPLVRGSAAMSADLPHAAAFVAVFAQLLACGSSRELTRLDATRLGLAAGLLLGAKISGLPALAAAVVVFGIAFAVRHVDARWVGAIAIVIVLATAAGGWWLIRNWIDYGSPVAPMGLSVGPVAIAPGPHWTEFRLHRSIAGDAHDPSYPLLSRTRAFVRLWLGRWYAFTLLPLLIVPLELAAFRRRPPPPWTTPRTIGWIAATTLSAFVVWSTADLPWTSLEFTGGLSLRFLLPAIVLLPSIGFVSLFSPVVRWYERTVVRDLVLLATAAFAIAAFWLSRIPDAPLGLDPVSAAVGLLLAIAVFAVRRYGSRPLAAASAAALIVVASGAAGRVIAARDMLAWSGARQALDRIVACGDRAEPHRAVLVDAMRQEAAAGRTCAARRFFVDTRFDLPLELQPERLSSLVFDTRRPGADFFDEGVQFTSGAEWVKRQVEREAPGARPGWCDYRVTGSPPYRVEPIYGSLSLR